MFRAASYLLLATAAIAAATAIAACGSSSPSSSSSGSSPTQAQIQQVVRFANCMRSHGVSNLPDPTTDPHGFKDSLNPTTAQSPAFRSAETACQHLLPDGGLHQSPTPAHSHAEIAAMLAFAHCLRGHGFPNFPDPNRGGDVTHEMLANAGIDIHQPAVVQAGDACTGVTHGFITRADVARFVAGQ